MLTVQRELFFEISTHIQNLNRMFFLAHYLLSQTFDEYKFKRSCPELDFLLDVFCSQIKLFVIQIFNHLNKDLLDVV